MANSELALSPASTPAPLARITRSGRVVVCPVDETLLIVIGAGGPMPEQAPAELDEDPSREAVASIIGWRLATPQSSATHGFAALVSAETTERLPTTIRFGTENSGRRHIVASRAASAGEVAVMLKELAGPQLVHILGRLVDVLMKQPSSDGRLGLIMSLLKAGTAADGYIELLGESHDDAIALKGWAHDMPAGVCRAIVKAETPSFAECSIAVFPRNDVPDGAAGFVGLLTAADLPRVRDIKGIYYRGRGAWRYAPIHERKVIAGPLETPGHIRTLLLQSQSAPQVLLSLRGAANGFDGTETISSLPVPVRLGVDTLYQGDDGAYLISGWLLDPDNHVESVRLRRQRADARLDDGWTRTERLDVEEAFIDRPEFKSAVSGHRRSHGFIGLVPALGGEAQASVHLELTLRDARRAYMPLFPVRLPARVAALRLLNAIDPTSWALPDIIDRQIVPFLTATRVGLPVIETVVDAGAFDQAEGPAILIVAGEAEEDFAALLGLLALDPHTRRAPIALALPADRFRRHAARIRQLAEFYRLPLRLVSVEDAGDVTDLAQAAAQTVDSETLILLSASLTPANPGWYRSLVAAHETNKASIISPTLAYEDHSIRWAGSTSLDRPDLLQSSRYAGYPVGAVNRLKLTRVAAASLDCCIMPRRALMEDLGTSPSYLGASLKGLDLALRLSGKGYDAYWLPSLQMVGSDEIAGSGSAATARFTERVDRTLFRNRWTSATETGNALLEGASA
ncbi:MULTISPECIES: hypothetical protein [unclassified Ensifer]|uniref:hypothetical protein n=1 Tax=unclassified Ensifer TaxID=2633371 RepID=UPI000812CCB6|nr:MULTISPECIES: hypothetical protein [unclassified Ensifer]OCP03369.1 hypothetical protein BC362_17605 [Ensifer sp. LC14]OCP03701.1 hypothetical protein BBX50_26750 [Ensifer sp. LC11]OCP03850.1 hypothetical protein BC374_26755 [Ensifer sp. LC13]OCP30264.1 hypothetical protein BC364_26770 [Ensifer sp. LC499]